MLYSMEEGVTLEFGPLFQADSRNFECIGGRITQENTHENERNGWPTLFYANEIQPDYYQIQVNQKWFGKTITYQSVYLELN